MRALDEIDFKIWMHREGFLRGCRNLLVLALLGGAGLIFLWRYTGPTGTSPTAGSVVDSPPGVTPGNSVTEERRTPRQAFEVWLGAIAT